MIKEELGNYSKSFLINLVTMFFQRLLMLNIVFHNIERGFLLSVLEKINLAIKINLIFLI